MIKSLAESGVFNQIGMTPFESAFNANLYEALNYLSVCREEDNERAAMIEKQNK